MTRRSFVVGLLAAAVICVASCALFALPWFSAQALFGVIAVLATCFSLISIAVSRMFSDQPLRVASVLSLAFVPVIALATVHSFHDRFAAAMTPTSDWVGIVAVALCSFTLTAAVALALRGMGRARAARGMFAMAMLAMVASAALLAHPRHGLLQPTGSSTLLARHASSDATVDAFEEQRPSRSAGSYSLGRSCVGSSCLALVGRGDTVRAIGPMFARSANLELRTTPQGELLLMAERQVIAVLSPELQQPGADPTQAASVARLGAPLSFRLLALAALLGGAIALAWRRRLTRRLAELEHAAEAVVHENGWWQIEGRAAMMRPQSGLTPGPALAYAAGAPVAPYRGGVSDGDARIVAGSKHSIRERLRTARDTLDTVTCAWLWPLATPLLVGFALAV